MDRRFVLAADACYTEEHLKRDIISPVHWHEQTMRESMEQLRRLSNQAGTELVFGHDQEQWQRIEAADGALSLDTLAFSSRDGCELLGHNHRGQRALAGWLGRPHQTGA
jgi:glyoxylase-like metal-dependent hydrolase (beta-lactamase superfamily II)